MKTQTCRTTFLIAFCLFFAVHASGVVRPVLAQKDKSKKNRLARGNPPEDSRTDNTQVGQDDTQSKKDKKLERQIQDEFNKQNIRGVEVSVRQGIATLTGKVDSEANRSKAGQIARKVTEREPNNGLSLPTPNNPGGRTLSPDDPADRTQVNGNTNSQPRNENRADTDAGEGTSFWDILKWALAIIGILFALGLLGYAIWTYVKSSRAQLANNFGGIKRRQDDLSNRFEASIATLKKEMNERLNSMNDEIRSLSVLLKNGHREILDSVRRSGAAAVYADSSNQTSLPKENVHTFPVAANDYLSKVKRGGTVVKPDFQNGILVQDPEGKGELLLVKDYDGAPGGLLYVVPMVPYFQTKQDFFNYYEKYYECPKATPGDVWIVQPAVVDKVSGGWELREKGELEIK